MNGYNPNKESSYQMYWNVNNFYGWMDVTKAARKWFSKETIIV